MITANNGILIVALFFGLGVHWNDHVMLALALALAGASYLVNIARDFDMHDLADKLFWAVFIAGLGGYVYAAQRLFGLL